MSDMDPQQPPPRKLTPEYIYALDQRIRELESQNDQLKELLKQAKSRLGQVSNVLEAQELRVQTKLTDIESKLGGQVDELGNQAAQAQKELVSQVEVIERSNLPKTMLLSNNYFLRALTIYGYIFVVGLVVGLFFGCLSVVLSMVSAIAGGGQ